MKHGLRNSYQHCCSEESLLLRGHGNPTFWGGIFSQICMRWYDLAFNVNDIKDMPQRGSAKHFLKMELDSIDGTGTTLSSQSAWN